MISAELYSHVSSVLKSTPNVFIKGYVNSIPYYYDNPLRGLVVRYTGAYPFVFDDCFYIRSGDLFVVVSKPVPLETHIWGLPYNAGNLPYFNEFNDAYRALVGKFFLSFVTLSGGWVDYHVSYDTFDDAFSFALSFAELEPNFHSINIRYLSSMGSELKFSNDFAYYDMEGLDYSFLGFTLSSCCYPDFAPIAQNLGGIPVTDQLTNLKTICQLLGVDTSENGLRDCALMKSYLQRLVTFFGFTFSDESNENLKLICQFLGVDTAENGLTDCALSKDYVKRIGIMLGAENA